MALEARIRRWGNSFAVVVPKITARKLKLVDGDSVLFDIEKKSNPLKDMFGAGKNTLKEPTSKILAESRKDTEGKWL